MTTRVTTGTRLSNLSSKAIATANQAIPNNVITRVSLSIAAGFDDLGAWDAANNQFTPTVAGVYLVTAGVTWDASGVGTRLVQINTNINVLAAVKSQPVTAAGDQTGQNAVDVVSFTAAQIAAGVHVWLEVLQDSGGALNTIFLAQGVPTLSLTHLYTR